MVWTIARKEFLQALLTFRFGIGLILCIVSVAAGTLAVIEDYGARREAFRRARDAYEERLQEEKPLSQLVYDLQVFREPRELAVFSAGSDRWQGNVANATHHEVPRETRWLGSSNPYMVIFRSIDVALIVQVILGLLALLFAYDAISGEREDDTLKLMLANPVARDQVLLGKAVGHLSVLGVIVLFGFVVALLFVQISPSLNLEGDQVARVAAMFAVSLLYVGAMYFAGLLLSTFTQRSATALVVAVFLWVCGVAVYPNAVAYGVNGLTPSRALRRAADGTSGQVVETFRAEFKDLTVRELETEWPNFGWGTSSSNFNSVKGMLVGTFATPEAMEEYREWSLANGLVRDAWPEPMPEEEINTRVAGFSRYFGQAEPLRAEYADRLWTEAWSSFEERLRRATALSRGLSALAPAGAYGDVASVLARTDRDDYWSFLAQARRYRKELIEHYEEEGYYHQREWYNSQARIPTLEGLPRFREGDESLWQSLHQARLSLALLGAFNVVFFLAAYWRFRRYEV
ncbi:ABC transporter permease subunit [Candidatus Latescibacterota bacterium]